MKFTKYKDGILVDFYTGLPVDDAGVDIQASGKVISSISMMDNAIETPNPRELYIMALCKPPLDDEALAKEYRDRNVAASLGSIKS